MKTRSFLKQSLFVRLCLALAAFALGATQADSQTYTITDLGTLGG